MAENSEEAERSAAEEEAELREVADLGTEVEVAKVLGMVAGLSALAMVEEVEVVATEVAEMEAVSEEGSDLEAADKEAGLRGV